MEAWDHEDSAQQRIKDDRMLLWAILARGRMSKIKDTNAAPLGHTIKIEGWFSTQRTLSSFCNFY